MIHHAGISLHRRFWDDEGLLFPMRVLTPGEAARYRACCDTLEQELGGAPRTIEVRQMHLHFRWAWGLAVHPRVLDAVEELLGPDLIVWATELFSKHPHERAISIGWHRDSTYMGFDPRSSVTAWIALSDSTIENGCLQAFPGPDRRFRRAADGTPVNVVLRAGEMSLHDSEILHGSAANLSDEKRVGFAVRYITPRAHGRSAPLQGIVARGCTDVSGFQPFEPPSTSEGTDAIAAMKQSAAKHFETMLETVRAGRHGQSVG